MSESPEIVLPFLHSFQMVLFAIINSFNQQSSRLAIVFSLVLALSGCVSSTNSSSVSSTAELSEGEFVGQVTGYEKPSEGFYKATVLFVDDRRVELDLIWPYYATCVENELLQTKSLASARQALENTLPIGSRVLVVSSGPGRLPLSFLHKLDNDSGKPTMEPPLESVNELLVQTGFWVPFEKGFEFDEYTYGSTYGVFNSNYLTPKQQEYAPIILRAGNKARSEKVGAMPICATLAINESLTNFYLGLSSREDEEQRRRAEIKSRSSSCRDGDGDGVCYER